MLPRLRRLSFCGKSARENASETESAFETSSKFGNTLREDLKLHIKEDVRMHINAGGTAG